MAKTYFFGAHGTPWYNDRGRVSCPNISRHIDEVSLPWSTWNHCSIHRIIEQNTEVASVGDLHADGSACEKKIEKQNVEIKKYDFI